MPNVHQTRGVWGFISIYSPPPMLSLHWFRRFVLKSTVFISHIIRVSRNSGFASPSPLYCGGLNQREWERLDKCHRQKFFKLNEVGGVHVMYFFVYFFGGLECVGHSFAYVAHFVFMKDVCIRTQRAAVASRLATNLATHLPNLATHPPT